MLIFILPFVALAGVGAAVSTLALISAVAGKSKSRSEIGSHPEGCGCAECRRVYEEILARAVELHRNPERMMKGGPRVVRGGRTILGQAFTEEELARLQHDFPDYRAYLRFQEKYRYGAPPVVTRSELKDIERDQEKRLAALRGSRRAGTR